MSGSSRVRFRSSNASSAIAIVLSGLMALVCVSSVAAQDSVASFYRGKTISLLVGYPPGGGYDVYARVMQRYFMKYIPGNPNVIVRNVPGAASLALVNQLYSVDARDGSVFGMFARSVAMDRLMGRQGANFDPTKLSWIGSANNEVSICTISGALGVDTVRDFMTRPITFGANAPGSESHMYPNILNNLLGANFRVVTGYPSSNDLMLAMERGETEGRCGWTISAAKTSHSEWLRQGQLFVAIQFAMEKHAELPDVPLVLDLARDEQQRQALELILSMQAMGRPFAAPPDIPRDRLNALRRALDAILADDLFLAEAEKQRLEIRPVSGESLEELISSMFKASPAVVSAARRAIAQ